VHDRGLADVPPAPLSWEIGMASPLGSRIVEWVDAVEEATVELRLLHGSMARGPGSRRPWQDDEGRNDCAKPLGAAVEDLTGDLDMAIFEAHALVDADGLLSEVARQLDDAGRQQLAAALDKLCEIDFGTRLDRLGHEVYTVRRLRAAAAVN
jgi:hypothetical protein